MLLIPLIFHPPAPASLNGFNRPVKLGLIPLSGAVFCVEPLQRRRGDERDMNFTGCSGSADLPGAEGLGAAGPASREERMTQWK